MQQQWHTGAHCLRQMFEVTCQRVYQKQTMALRLQLLQPGRGAASVHGAARTWQQLSGRPRSFAGSCTLTPICIQQLSSCSSRSSSSSSSGSNSGSRK
jgi:hypothetical protein